MPCHPARARELIKKGKAIRRFDRGLFYIKLTQREDGEVQKIAAGIDPGSKKEAVTLKSRDHTFLNIQADAVTWVGEAEETSTMMRKNRRYRKTPYRKMRVNRSQGKIRLPSSTRARWQWKLRLINWLARYYPIRTFVVEDIAAKTRKGKGSKWNKSFSPLEVGKDWFYYQLGKIAGVELKQGYETAAERDRLSLKKTKSKLSDKFEAHCVDSWTLANMEVGGHDKPDNVKILYIAPLRFHRRQLHALQFTKGGKRRPYGGSLSLGFKRGSWVKHPKYGLCYVGGGSAGLISLHSPQTSTRIAKAKPTTLTFLCTASWRIRKENAHSPVT